MLRREKCYWSPPYSRQHIVLAKKNVCKSLKQALSGYYYSNQNAQLSFFLLIYVDNGGQRVVELAASS